MRITNTINKLLLPLICGACLLFVWGCSEQNGLEKARHDLKQSRQYYHNAVDIYKSLIQKGKDLDGLYFELGRLYYDHGEFENAIDAFRHSGLIEARKFLAIAYYHSGNFTDALEVFNKQEISDDEYLFYKGLTCEKLNLFDKATDSYRKIKDIRFIAKALERIELIEKQASVFNIKDLDPQVYKILAEAPGEEKYPQAGALILLCDEKAEISPEGTQVFYMHYLVKILNERGKEGFAETHVDYDSTFDKVELEFARTIKPNGEVVDVGKRHIRDVSKYLNFPLYSNARAYIISFPEITEGAAVEYKLKIYRSQLINKKDFVLSYPVQDSEPVILANFSVSLPKDKQLHMKAINDKYNNFGASLEPDVKEKDGRIVYSWQFKDIPQILPELNMPPHVQINPAFLLSTFSSWQDIYNWWRGLSKDKIKADESLKNKVKDLISGLDTDEAKIRAIYNFCAREIRYVAVEYGQAGFEPHPAADIFKNKYGDCKDQAILLVTMLREAGFTAWPVLIGTKEYYNLNEDFPSVLFNHCIAAVSFKDKVVFLDPTAETCSFGSLPAGDQERKVLVFREDGYKIENTPLYAADHNRITQRINLKINSDEAISAEKNNFTYGVYDQAQRYWLLYTPPELIKERLAEKIQDISIGSKLDSYSIKNLENLNEPVVLSYAFHGSGYLTEAGPLRIMPQLSNMDTSIVAKDKRKYPVDFGILDTKEISLEIEIPESFTLKYVPDSVKKDSPWLAFSCEYERKDSKIHFRQKMELKKNTVSEQEYAEFKRFFEELAKQVKQRIVFEKIK